MNDFSDMNEMEVFASRRIGNAIAAKLRRPADGYFRFPFAILHSATAKHKGGGDFDLAVRRALALANDPHLTAADASAWIRRIVGKYRSEQAERKLERS